MLWIRITLMWIRMRIRILLITLMRIRNLIFYLVLIRIRLFTLMRILIRIQILASKMAQTLEKGLNRLIFHTFWLDICKLMRTRIRFRIQLINYDADPDPVFYMTLMRIQVTKMMRILADPDADPGPTTLALPLPEHGPRNLSPELLRVERRA
jgi:hypothetical protein